MEDQQKQIKITLEYNTPAANDDLPVDGNDLSLAVSLLNYSNQKFKAMTNNEKVLLALAGGLVAGAILGVLFAPHKGSKTRRMMKEEGKKVVEDLREKFDEGVSGLKNEIVDVVKEAAGAFMHES